MEDEGAEHLAHAPTQVRIARHVDPARLGGRPLEGGDDERHHQDEVDRRRHRQRCAAPALVAILAEEHEKDAKAGHADRALLLAGEEQPAHQPEARPAARQRRLVHRQRERDGEGDRVKIEHADVEQRDIREVEKDQGDARRLAKELRAERAGRSARSGEDGPRRLRERDGAEGQGDALEDHQRAGVREYPIERDEEEEQRREVVAEEAHLVLRVVEEAAVRGLPDHVVEHAQVVEVGDTGAIAGDAGERDPEGVEGHQERDQPIWLAGRARRRRGGSSGPSGSSGPA